MTHLPLIPILTLALVAIAPRVPAAGQDAAADSLFPGAPLSPGADVRLERTLAGRVSDLRARDAVRELVALGPRMGGTRSGRLATQWRLERFGELGLPVRLRVDPLRWCHEESSWRVVAHPAGGEPTPLESAWPYGFSPSAQGRASLTLEPAAAGAWLSERSPRPGRDAPTPALVLVDGATTLDGSHPVVHSLPPGDANPFPVFGLSRPDGELLRAWLAQERRVEVEVELTAVIRRRPPRTVVATLAAREGAPGGHLLFCAHGDSDSGGPGANDNASGEAIVLEIARVWSGAVRDGLLPAPPRAVRFAVWGSEIHSTRAYLERYGEGDDPVLAVINYDQAGFGSGAEQLNVEPDDLPANEGLVRIVTGVLAEHAGSEGFPELWATNKSLGGTDSYVFSGSQVFQGGRRPALTLFTSAWGTPAEHEKTDGMPGESWSERELVRVDYDNYYHSAGDLPENTTDREPHNMGWCARVGLLAGLRWLAQLDD